MSKKTRTILIAIIIVLLIILMCIIYFLRKNVNRFSNSNINNEETVIMDALPTQYLFEVLKVYRGNIDRNIINKTYYKFSSVIVSKYRNLNLNDASAKEYFAKNKNEIEKEIGIVDVEDFVNLIQVINTLNINTVETIKPIEETLYTDSLRMGNELSVYFEVKYNNGQELVFDTTIKNVILNEKDETAIVFKADVNNEKLEKIKQKMEDNRQKEMENTTRPARGVPAKWDM